MTWPELPDSTVVARVLGATVVFDQRSAMLARVDDIGAFVLAHRHHFTDHGDAARELTALLGADPIAVETDLLALEEEVLADLGEGEPAALTPPTGRPQEPPVGSNPASWSIDALGVPIEVRCHTAALDDVVAPLLAAHPPAVGPPRHRCDVWDDAGITVTQDGRAVCERVSIDVAVSGLTTSITALAILTPRDGLAVHAAALVDRGSAVLLGGGSGAGKSTTSVELLARGWTFLTDEVVELDPATGAIRGLPRPIGVEGPARGWRPQLRPPWLVDDEPQLHRWPVPPGAIGQVGERGELGLVAHLEFDGSAAATAEPIEPMQALGRLCALTFNRDRLTGEVLGLLGDLLERVPSVVVHHAGAKLAADAIVDRWNRRDDG